VKSNELWLNDLILHNDNVPAHKELPAKQFLAQKSIAEIKYPYYSTDLGSE
jgi:hypothetical protein